MKNMDTEKKIPDNLKISDAEYKKLEERYTNVAEILQEAAALTAQRRDEGVCAFGCGLQVAGECDADS